MNDIIYEAPGIEISQHIVKMRNKIFQVNNIGSVSINSTKNNIMIFICGILILIQILIQSLGFLVAALSVFLYFKPDKEYPSAWMYFVFISIILFIIGYIINKYAKKGTAWGNRITHFISVQVNGQNCELGWTYDYDQAIKIAKAIEFAIINR